MRSPNRTPTSQPRNDTKDSKRGSRSSVCGHTSTDGIEARDIWTRTSHIEITLPPNLLGRADAKQGKRALGGGRGLPFLPQVSILQWQPRPSAPNTDLKHNIRTFHQHRLPPRETMLSEGPLHLARREIRVGGYAAHSGSRVSHLEVMCV